VFTLINYRRALLPERVRMAESDLRATEYSVGNYRRTGRRRMLRQ
jgi:hypothetical protein